MESGHISPDCLAAGATDISRRTVRICYDPPANGSGIEIEGARRTGDGHFPAGKEYDVHGIGGPHDDAATDAESGGRRADRRAVGGADLAANETKHALRDGDRKLAGGAFGIVDKAVDDQLRARSNDQRGLVDEQDLRLADRRGNDALLERNVGTDIQGARCLTRWCPRDLGIDRGSCPDASRDRALRSQCHQRNSRQPQR